MKNDFPSANIMNLFKLIIFLINLSLIKSTSIPSTEGGKCLIEPGDVNIAVMWPFSRYIDKDNFCSDEIVNIHRPEYTEIFKYAVSEINRNNNLLPNIKLGKSSDF